MFVVVAYDISDDKRRTRLFKTLLRFGQATQFSLFECDITPVQFERLLQAMAQILRPEDHVRCYELCRSCHQRIHALGKPLAVNAPVYVV